MDTMNINFYTAPIGKIKIEDDGCFITGLSLAEENCKCSGIQSELSEIACKELTEYFNGQRKVFDLPLKPQGTEFQKSVWEALRQIPYGQTRSYAQIAEALNNPKGYRAVGMANNKNPILILIPCHRVIGKNGNLKGFAAGLSVKEYLLNLENRFFKA